METVKGSVVAKDQEGERYKRGGTQRIFQGNETTLYDTIMVDTYYYTFVKTLRTYNSKSEPYCKLGTSGNYDVSMSVHSL